MTENFDDRNFIHIICIADTIPMTQSSKKRVLRVTTHEIPRHLTQSCIFKCGECGQKFYEYHLLKAHTHSCGHVVKKCMERGCNKIFLTKGPLRQHIMHHGGKQMM